MPKRDESLFAVTLQETPRSLLARHRLLWTVVALWAIYLTSLTCMIRLYTSFAVFQFGVGQVAAYWGGDKVGRDGAVLNAGEWPVGENTHFAGVDPEYFLEKGAGGRWEYYGPSVWLNPATLIDYLREDPLWALGLSWPMIRVGVSDDGTECSVLVPPVWPAGCALAILIWRRHRENRMRSARGFPVVPIRGPAGTSGGQ